MIPQTDWLLEACGKDVVLTSVAAGTALELDIPLADLEKKGLIARAPRSRKIRFLGCCCIS